MARLLLIASLVALFMYTGFVLESGTVATTIADSSGITNLEGVLEATGARLERVVITGWVEVEQPGAREQVAAALGWSDDSAPAGEERELKLHRRDGKLYLAVLWSMEEWGSSAWPVRYNRVQRALHRAGSSPGLTVQLEGRTEQSDLLATAQTGMDLVHATDREPWTGPSAASVAGRSTLLPPSPFGVNVQIALRQDPSGKGARVWVAWPALLQEY